MRIVATSDTHHRVDVVKWIPDGDVFIHAGDLMRTGYPSDFEAQLEWLAELKHPIKLFVPGNHDFHLQVYPGPALQQLRAIGVTVVGLPGNTQFSSYTLPNGMTVLGMPQVTNLPRWAFNDTEDRIWAFMRSKGYHDIVVSHAPAYGVLDRVPSKGGMKNVGNDAFTAYARAYKPKHWFHGHIHEDYGNMKFLETEFHNVAMCNRNYEHANPPIVVDL